MAVKVAEEDWNCVFQRKNGYSRSVFASASASLPLPLPVSSFPCNPRTCFATLFKNSLLLRVDFTSLNEFEQNNIKLVKIKTNKTM